MWSDTISLEDKLWKVKNVYYKPKATTIITKQRVIVKKTIMGRKWSHRNTQILKCQGEKGTKNK